MQDPETYRQYADDCTKLARTMPQHREKLIEMAATWQRLAEAAEKRNGGKRPEQTAVKT
jgi:hypothetical protein